jgi:hypothetical protein
MHSCFFSIFKYGEFKAVRVRVTGSWTHVLISLEATEYKKLQRQIFIIATILIDTPAIYKRLSHTF